MNQLVEADLLNYMMHAKLNTKYGIKAVRPLSETPKSQCKRKVDQAKIDICLNCTRSKCNGSCENFKPEGNK